LAFHARFALGPGLGHRSRRDQVIERNHLRFDEAFFKVGVDDASSLRSLPAFVDRPRPRLFGPGSEIRLQTESVESNTGELVEAALLLAGGSEQLGCILRVEIDEFALQL